MFIRPVRPRHDLEFNLIQKVSSGSRHQLHVSAVTSAMGRSVAVEAFVDTVEGDGFKPTGRVFIFRQHLQGVIDALVAAKAVVDALPAAGDAQ